MEHERAPRADILSEDELVEVVGRFYARVRLDAVLGPVFEQAVHDWNRHLHRLVAFWSAVVNGSGRYRGDPMQAHAAHAGRITAPMFDRWLDLWRETTRATLDEERAALMTGRAERMAEAIRRHLSL